MGPFTEMYWIGYIPFSNKTTTSELWKNYQ